MKRDDSGSEIIIVGAGWHAKEICSYLSDLAANGNETFHARHFVDENRPKGILNGADILGGFEDLESYLRKRSQTTFAFITAVGDNRARATFIEKIGLLDAKNLEPWTLRHPRSTVGQYVEIGEGTCLAPGTIITTHAKIGKHCILNVNGSVSHDCVVGDFVNMNPGAVVCGNVRIGRGCYIGAGATIIDKVSVGAWSVIGAGAVVINDIPDNVTAVGVPARIIKHQAL